MLLISGWSRTGSTVLGNLLGARASVTHVGELRGIWHHMQLESATPCGCGRPHWECPFWTEVFRRAFPNQDYIHLRYLQHMREKRFSLRPRSALALERDLRAKPPRPIAADYAAHITAVYSTIAEMASTRVIVDSTKDPGYVRLVAALAEVNAYVVHLVRDPRAVAYSWRRRPIFGMNPGPGKSSASWLIANLQTESVLRRMDRERGRFLRYEDLMQAPRETVEGIHAWLGLAPDGPQWIGHDRVLLEPNHTVAGNPSRFEVGEVALRLDDEWKDRLPASAALAATIPALPRLSRYGYPVNPTGKLDSARTPALSAARPG